MLVISLGAVVVLRLSYSAYVLVAIGIVRFIMYMFARSKAFENKKLDRGKDSSRGSSTPFDHYDVISKVCLD